MQRRARCGLGRHGDQLFFKQLIGETAQSGLNLRGSGRVFPRQGHREFRYRRFGGEQQKRIGRRSHQAVIGTAVEIDCHQLVVKLLVQNARRVNPVIRLIIGQYILRGVRQL